MTTSRGNAPANAEYREHAGLRELSRRVGRILVEVKCPFCGDYLLAYLWSLAGSGKRCACGAVVYRLGAYRPTASRRKAATP